jgi:hypothetical protein
MEPVFFVLAILGCGDDGGACLAQRTDGARYATVAECRAQLPAALARSTDLSFPVIAARCEASGPQVAAAAPPPHG